MRGDAAVEAWFLRSEERGNRSTSIDRRRDDRQAFSAGNEIELLVHGAPYFDALHRELCGTEAGDLVAFADWRGDPDEHLADGQTLADVLVVLARRGVVVRGLVWRSHSKLAGFHLEHHVELARRVNEAGGQIVLDQRVRRAGSHHQKLVLIRHAGEPARDVAFMGGIDLCHGRRDDQAHRGDPQPEDLDDAYGERPPWHDIQIAVRGPAVGDLDLTFRERWNDPAPPEGRRGPLRAAVSRASDQPDRIDPMPATPPDPPAAGTSAVQVLRTYPVARPPYPFAPEGERSIVHAYRQAFERARSLIYVEDQYLWSSDVGALFAEAMERTPTLRLIVVVPRIPDRNGPISGPPHRLAQLELVDRLDRFGRDRFAILDLENEQGTPIYVHAKTVVIDDTWAAIGSDNLNRRSWTHDSELSCAILDAGLDEREPSDPGGHGDGARRFARDLRLTLMREHLGLDDDDGSLADPAEAFARARRAADDLDAWHADGRRGPRPAGRLRHHGLPDVRWWERWWAWPVYRTLVDPDGRPRAMRRRGEF